uniref:ZP domain-containing protein n=1 Tax=Panagrolaimus sp. JU765 TaxID=591449 RepID=A0AC34QZG6_9BILA
MLVHSCFVDDGAGQDRKSLLDEHGCTIDPVIVPDLTYNHAANLAYTEVSAFKFADKVTTYFQCAVSTCMVSEGMCEGKTPPRCGVNSNAFNGFKRARRQLANSEPAKASNSTNARSGFDFTMDLSADKIVVFDLDDLKAENEAAAVDSHRRFAASSNRFVISKSPQVCLSQTTIFSLVLFLAIITIVALFLVVYQIYRRNGFSIRKF